MNFTAMLTIIEKSENSLITITKIFDNNESKIYKFFELKQPTCLKNTNAKSHDFAPFLSSHWSQAILSSSHTYYAVLNIIF